MSVKVKETRNKLPEFEILFTGKEAEIVYCLLGALSPTNLRGLGASSNTEDIVTQIWGKIHHSGIPSSLEYKGKYFNS